MPDQIAPAPSSSAPAPAAARASTQPPPDDTKVHPAVDGKPARGERGQFAPKNGAPATQEASGDQPQDEKPKSAKERLLEQVDDDGNVLVKIDGKMQRVPFDRALAELEMGFAGKKRFTEFDRQRREFEASKSKAKEQLDEHLRQLGVDPDAWAEQRILQRIEAEKQRAANPYLDEQQKLKKERDELDLERKKLDSEKTSAELTWHEQQIDKMLAVEVPAALKAVDLAVDDPDVVDGLKGYLREAVAAGVELTPAVVKAAAAVTAEAEDRRVETRILKLDVPMLLKRFPEAAKVWIDRIRRYDMEEYERRKNGGTAPAPKQTSPNQPRPARSQYMTDQEWRAEQRRLGLL